MYLKRTVNLLGSAAGNIAISELNGPRFGF